MQQKSGLYNKKDGFLYLDLMIVLIMLSFCMVTLGRSVSLIAAIIHNSNKRIKGLHVATQLLDSFLITHELPANGDVDGYCVACGQKYIFIHSDLQFCLGSVTVTWLDMDQVQRSLSLSDGYFDDTGKGKIS